MLRKSELLPESAVPQSSAVCFHVFQTNCVPFSRFWFALVAIKLQVQSGGKMKGLFLCKLLSFFVSVAFLMLLSEKRHCIALQPKDTFFYLKKLSYMFTEKFWVATCCIIILLGSEIDQISSLKSRSIDKIFYYCVEMSLDSRTNQLPLKIMRREIWR